MRIYLQLSNSKETIPFNYQSYLTGAIHKWIGANNTTHGASSLYSFSWLQNIDTVKNGLRTKSDSFFFISAYNETLIKKIIKGILADPILCFGINITNVRIQNNPIFTEQERFFSASPIFIKRRFDGKERHIIYEDNSAGKYLTETIKKKAILAEVEPEGLNISFDKEYPTPKSKIIYYKDIGNKVSICPIVVEGTPEQIAFAWNVGVGNSTGIGFGALK